MDQCQGLEAGVGLAKTVQLDTSDRRRTSLLAMAAVVAVPVVGLFELFRTNEPQATRLIRLLIVLISVVFLAGANITRAVRYCASEKPQH